MLRDIEDIILRGNIEELQDLAKENPLSYFKGLISSDILSHLVPYYNTSQINRLMLEYDEKEKYDDIIELTRYLPISNDYYIHKVYNNYTDVSIIVRDCQEFMFNNDVGKCNFIVNFSFSSMYYLSSLLSNHLLPHMNYFYNYHRQMFLVAVKKNIPDNVMLFFYHDYPYEYLKRRKIWSLERLSNILDDPSTDINSPFVSFKLMFSYPEMLYHESMKPRMYMELYRSSNSLEGFVIDDMLYCNNKYYHIYDSDVGNDKLDLHNSHQLYSISGIAIPVIRYSKSKDVGLYHPRQPNKQICGTFYYYEPESTTYLISEGNVLIDKTKTSVALHLLQTFSDTSTNRYDNFTKLEKAYVDVITNNSNVEDYKDGLLHPDMLYTPEEAVDELRYKSIITDNIEQYPMYLGSSSLKYYKESDRGMYATEDDFDQPLCIELRSRNIDLAILTNMIGAFQIVTEILDTRDRSISFDNLVYTSVV